MTSLHLAKAGDASLQTTTSCPAAPYSQRPGNKALWTMQRVPVSQG